MLRNGGLALLTMYGSLASGPSIRRMYDARAIQQLRNAFAKALEDFADRELAVHDFIKANPLLLHQFSPLRIFSKALIMSAHETDFVLVTARKQLALIELERPSRPLVIGGGEMSAELKHALSQLNDWAYKIHNHRAAVIENMGVRPDEIDTHSSVLIMGRDAGTPPEHLKKLRWQLSQYGVEFFTYDDILRSLSTLAETIERL